MGIVYLLCELSDNPRFKIGITKKGIKTRINQLKTGNSNDIHLVNKFESEHYKHIEIWLHRRFNKYKVNEGGTEWFDLPNECVIDFIKHCKEVEATIIFLKENNHFFK